jgi:hypothetical protein
MRLQFILPPAMLALAVSPAFAQLAQPLPIATVTCRDIAKVQPAYQAAVIYYAAGYRDGLDYGLSVQGVQTAQAQASAAIASPSAPAASSAPPPGATVDTNNGGSNATGVVAGLTLQPQDIITACKAAPDVLLTDIIANHGGATGMHGTPGGIVSGPVSGAVVSNGSGDVPANSSGGAASTTNGSGTAGTNSTTNSGAGAVNDDLNNAGAQNQQNIAAPPGTATNPAAGKTPGAATTGTTGTGATSP